MAVGLAVEKQSAAAVLPQGSGQKIGKIMEVEIGDLVFTIGNIELHVIVNAAEGDRVTAVDPVIHRGAFVLVSKFVAGPILISLP